MAEVWLAEDLMLTRPVAVKVLKPQLASDPVIAERFRREAVAAASLNHPNIVAIYDTVDEGGRQAVVMQYVPGRSLRELLDDRQQLSPEMTIRIARAVASALDRAHSANIVHRDVKPGNIMLTSEGGVLLTDFGIAKATSGETDLTSDNIMMGTAKYLSPEQVRGRKLDGRADLYSLGLVLYECLAGRVPFRGDSDADTALARLQRDPTPLGRLRPNLPFGLAELIHRLLARSPDDRPSSGAAIIAALDRVATAPREPTPITGPQRQPTPRHGLSAVAGLDGARPEARQATPSKGVDTHGRPARQFQHRRLPSAAIVGALALVAVILIVVLWNGLSSDNSTSPSATPSVAPGGTTKPATVPTKDGLLSFVAGTAQSFDPLPAGNGNENDDLLPNLFDGSSSTVWKTACYQDAFLGSKHGVGFAVQLQGSGAGTLRVGFLSSPWIASVYASSGQTMPKTLADWGPAVVPNANQATDPAGTFQIPDSSSYLLVWIQQLPRDPACSAVNPFRATVTDISLNAS
jgi:eukaryotic-like serine/threonine-protein kinase